MQGTLAPRSEGASAGLGGRIGICHLQIISMIKAIVRACMVLSQGLVCTKVDKHFQVQREPSSGQ